MNGSNSFAVRYKVNMKLFNQVKRFGGRETVGFVTKKVSEVIDISFEIFLTKEGRWQRAEGRRDLSRC